VEDDESADHAFVQPVARDNALEMPTPAARPNWEQHPLLLDRARLQRVTELMWFQIQKKMFPAAPRRSSSNPSGNELTIVGGTSAEDVLREALAALLQYESQEQVEWEGLAITIAQRRAVDAVRRARKHRRLSDGTEIDITSLDRERDDGRPIADTIADPDQLTEQDVVDSLLRADRLRAIGTMARETLSQRDRDIFYRVTRGEPLVAISPEVDLTPQRVGQIYRKSLRQINAALKLDPRFQRLYDLEGGTSDE
jgi:DNA-directed RNA polymerase specialized sigma24 family protein